MFVSLTSSSRAVKKGGCQTEGRVWDKMVMTYWGFSKTSRLRRKMLFPGAEIKKKKDG